MRDQLTEMIQPVVEGMGCELWGIERESSGSNSTIKVYIDAEQGVDIEDCARISRQVSSLLDVEEPLLGGYTLEVSLPKLTRVTVSQPNPLSLDAVAPAPSFPKT